MQWGSRATCRVWSAANLCSVNPGSRFAAQTVRGESGEILAPTVLMLGAELVKIIPGIDPGVVQIVEFNPDGVIADRFQLHDPDMGTAVDQCLLSRTVPPHLRGWALDAQILGR